MSDETIWTMDEGPRREKETDPRLTGKAPETPSRDAGVHAASWNNMAPAKVSEPQVDENGRTVPEAGMGATLMVGSDRYPFTIVAVHSNGREFLMPADHATRLDSNGQSEDQTWEYRQNLLGDKKIVRKHKDGHWSNGGTPVFVGARRMYRDPSF